MIEVEEAASDITAETQLRSQSASYLMHKKHFNGCLLKYLINNDNATVYFGRDWASDILKESQTRKRKYTVGFLPQQAHRHVHAHTHTHTHT